MTNMTTPGEPINALRAADLIAALTWANIAAKPSTFAPSSHTHLAGDLPSTILYQSGNLAGLASIATAKTNLGLGTGDNPTFAGLTLTGLSTEADLLVDGTVITNGLSLTKVLHGTHLNLLVENQGYVAGSGAGITLSAKYTNGSAYPCEIVNAPNSAASRLLVIANTIELGGTVRVGSLEASNIILNGSGNDITISGHVNSLWGSWCRYGQFGIRAYGMDVPVTDLCLYRDFSVAATFGASGVTFPGSVTSLTATVKNGSNAPTEQIRLQYSLGGYSHWIGSDHSGTPNGALYFKTNNGITDTYAASTLGLTIQNGNIICPGSITGTNLNIGDISSTGTFSNLGPAATTGTYTLLSLGGTGAGFSGPNDADTVVAIDFKGTSYLMNGGGIVPYVGGRIAMQKAGTWNAANGGTGKGNLVFSTSYGGSQFSVPMLREVLRLDENRNATFAGAITASGTVKGMLMVVDNDYIGSPTLRLSSLYQTGFDGGSSILRFWANSVMMGYFAFGSGFVSNYLITASAGLDVIGNITASSVTPLIQLTASNTGVAYGLSLGLDGGVKLIDASGVLTINSGRNSSWGGSISFVTDTVERLRVSQTGIITANGTVRVPWGDIANPSIQLGDGTTGIFRDNNDIVIKSGNGEKLRILHAHRFVLSSADPEIGYGYASQSINIHAGRIAFRNSANNADCNITAGAITASAFTATGDVTAQRLALGGFTPSTYGVPFSVLGQTVLQGSGITDGGYVASIFCNAVTGSAYGILSQGTATADWIHFVQNAGAGSATTKHLVAIGSGDARTAYQVNGGAVWTVGLDQSDSSKFKISSSVALGTNDRLTIDASGNAVFTGSLFVNSGGNESGVIASGSSAETQFGFSNSSSGRRYNLVVGGSSPTVGVPAGAFAIRDYTAGYNRLIIDTSGNVVFGGTLTANSIVLQDGGAIVGGGVAAIQLGDSNDTLVIGAATNYITGSTVLRGTLSNDSGSISVTSNIVSTGAITTSGTVTSTFQSLSANPSTLDLTASQSRLVKNTTSGVLSMWANDGGSLKSVALT